MAPLAPSEQSCGESCWLAAVQMGLRINVSGFHWAPACTLEKNNIAGSSFFFIVLSGVMYFSIF
jgi:hypothetical protein